MKRIIKEFGILTLILTAILYIAAVALIVCIVNLFLAHPPIWAAIIGVILLIVGIIAVAMFVKKLYSQIRKVV